MIHDAAPRFRALVQRSLGLALEDVQSDRLETVLEGRAKARRTSVDRYLAALDDATFARIEAPFLASELTVGETFFFRHAEQLQAFVDVALPGRASARGSASAVRILCVGCSTGEEPYSLAILAAEVGSPLGREAIRAIDASASAIARAELAAYTRWSLREVSALRLSRFFAARGAEHTPLPIVREAVRFEVKNAADAAVDLGAPGSLDVVFCRNVLMYFDAVRAREVVARLSRALAPGGYLFLGHAETLRGVSDDFELCHAHGAFFHRRIASGPRDTDGREAAWHEEIRRASDRIRALTTPATPAPALRTPRALDAARTASEVEARLLQAVALVQAGALDRAEASCEALLAHESTRAAAHHLLALCREATGDRAGAGEHDRQAVALDPSFALAHLHLGMRARRSGEVREAHRALRLALAWLERETPARLSLFGGGFGRDALIELARAELRACGEIA